MTWKEYYRYYLVQLQKIYTVEEAAAITALVYENKAGVSKIAIAKLQSAYLLKHQCLKED